VSDPIFWLGLSILLVAVSLTAVLVAALPALQAVAKAARSLEKLADTLSREFPPTLEAIRMTGLEISELTDNVTEGVQSAGKVVKQVDQSIGSAKQQAKQVQNSTGSFLTGVRVAWKTFTRPSSSPSLQQRRDINRLPASQESITDYSEVYQRPSTEEEITSDSIAQTPNPEADLDSASSFNSQKTNLLP
jgi:hypothetical protein